MKTQKNISPIEYDKQRKEEIGIIILKKKLNNIYKNYKFKYFPATKVLKVKQKGNKELIEEYEEPMSLAEFFEKYMQDEDIKISFKKCQTKMQEEFRDFREKCKDV